MMRDGCETGKRRKRQRKDIRTEKIYENYELGSEDSILEDDEDRPKRPVPKWAQKEELERTMLFSQSIDPYKVFPLQASLNILTKAHV